MIMTLQKSLQNFLRNKICFALCCKMIQNQLNLSCAAAAAATALMHLFFDDDLQKFCCISSFKGPEVVQLSKVQGRSMIQDA